MGLGESIKTCIAKMTTFSGRASRSEYWWWQLFELIIAVPLLIIIFLLFAANGKFAGGLFFYFVSVIILFLVNLSVMVRRLHDTGHSGVAYFIVLVPFVGSFILLYWMLCDSTPGDNQYGPNPKEVRANKRSQKRQSASREQAQRYSSKANSRNSSRPLVDYSGGSVKNEREEYEAPQPAKSPRQTSEPQPEQPVAEETRMMDISADSVLSKMPKLVCDGTSYLLSEGVNIVGRQSQNSQATVQIATDDRYMSRNHSRITVANLSGDLKVLISNYENKNSTYVNDQELLDDKEIRLTDGDEIKMGHTIVTFKL